MKKIGLIFGLTVALVLVTAPAKAQIKDLTSIDEMCMPSSSTPAVANSFSPDSIFCGRKDFHVGAAPVTGCAADFNNDGFTDFVIVDHWDPSNALSVFFSAGRDSFVLDTAHYYVDAYATYLATSDFDRDGYMDLAVSTEVSERTVIFLNDGNGHFTNSGSYYPGTGGHGTFDVADLNSDSFPDIVVPNCLKDSIYVLINNQDGTFHLSAQYYSGFCPLSVALGSIDSDGDNDAVAVNKGENSVSIFVNDGYANFSLAGKDKTGAEPYFVILEDLNNDSHNDIAIINHRNNSISIKLNRGDGTFSDTMNYSINSYPRIVCPFDLDRDGWKDLVVSNFSSGNISVLLNKGDGTFQPKIDFPTPYANPVGVFALDWDVVVTSSNGANGVSSVFFLCNTPQYTQIICDAFLTAHMVNVKEDRANKPTPGSNPSPPKHDFKIHLLPCEPIVVSVGDSAEVFVDTDKDGSFEADERYPAAVSSTDSNGYASDIAIKVFIGEDLINNDPCVSINSVNEILIVDTLEHRIDYLCLNTFTPPQGQPPKVPQGGQAVKEFELSQNYPNPFNPETEISYSLPNDSYVKLAVYNIRGQKVKTLVNAFEKAGCKAIRWDGTDDTGQKVASGIYFYRIEAKDFVQTRKMVLMK